MDAEKTGKLIKELRTEKNLTQQELASRLKVSSTAVSKWENGKNLPDISMLEPLAETLGVPIYDIVKGKSPAQKEETEMAAETASETNLADRPDRAGTLADNPGLLVLLSRRACSAVLRGILGPEDPSRNGSAAAGDDN